jgi:hypothetical protein
MVETNRRRDPPLPAFVSAKVSPWAHTGAEMKPKRAAARRYLPASPFNVPAALVPPVEQFALQDRVSHDKYGLGKVIAVEDGVAVLVDFGTQRVRIVAPYAKLVKL